MNIKHDYIVNNSVSVFACFHLFNICFLGVIYWKKEENKIKDEFDW